MEEYAEIKIRVLAPIDEINGPNEMKLSDAVYEIERELEEWLKKRAIGTQFEFIVIADTN